MKKSKTVEKKEKRSISKDIKIVARALSYMKNWPSFIITFANLMSNYVILNLIFSSFLKYSIEAIEKKDERLLWIQTSIHASAFLLWVVISCFCNYRFNMVRLYANQRMRVSLFERMEHYRYTDIDNNHTGDCMARLTGDCGRAYTLIGWGIGHFVMRIITITVGCVTILPKSPLIGGVILGLAAIGLISSVSFAKKTRPINDKIRKLISEQTSRLVDMIAGSRLMKLFNFGRHKLDDFAKKVDDAYDQEMKEMGYFVASNFVSNILEICMNFGVSILGMYLVFTKKISLSNMVFIMGMRWDLFWPIRSMGNIIMYVQGLLSSAERVFEFMDKPVETEGYGDGIPDVSGAEAVAFRGVGFSYSDNQPVFKGADFIIPTNSMTAVVGQSGAGKSTLFKLILQFYKHSDGEIKVFGNDVSKYSLKNLRDIIAYVPQTPSLFDFTIYENISLGKPGATRDEIEAAAKSAYAHDFIMDMPDGYQTKVGEMGNRLSGGQRQRIAIARAILKNAPVLLLDEATSSLDSESEKQVQDALDSLMRGRTILVAAHRLSTIQHADNILVFDKGAVAQQGKHEELLAKGGVYADLYAIQFESNAKA